ncbi:uncharacterized protein LOC126902507 [Daktulosphaira vitifoliae]|uniref:uncharacterized protein LOC126902507 n=1 Tax=Daktulosphaira vitifoliae TaxID=58002 RepID=UPI0021A99B84|nr:uncharacterized protein LOC126902507 [Daktulosphaira vitifoliae]
MTRNIYDNARAVTILCTIVGISSLKNVFSGRIMFKWDKQCLWPIFLFGIQFYSMLLISLTNRTPMAWFWFWFYMFKEVCRIITTIYSDQQLPAIIESIYKFDLEHNNSPLKYKKPKYLILYIIMSIIILLCSIIKLKYAGLNIRNIGIVLVNYITFKIPLMYLFCCDEVYSRFKSLERQWRIEVSQIIKSDSREVTFQKLESERLAHAMLCDIIDNIRMTFGYQIASHMLFIFLEHLLRFYFHAYVLPVFFANHPQISTTIMDGLEPYLFLVNTWTGIYLIAYMTDILTESSRSIVTDLRSIPLWKLPNNCSKQVDMFLTQVQNSNTEIMASGLFVVNRSLLSSVIMSLATYIIVIVQLSPDLNRVFIDSKISCMLHDKMSNKIYDNVKSLLILSKIFGMTSLTIVENKIKFNWDISCLWPILLFLILSYGSLSIALQFRTTISWCWALFGILREFFRLITVFYSDYQIPSLLENIYKFDLTHNSSKIKRKIPIYSITYVVLTFILNLCAIIEFKNNGFTKRYICKILMNYVTPKIPLMYFFFCDELCLRFKSLKIQWQLKVSHLTRSSSSKVACQIMEYERLAHAKLCDVVDDTQKAFGYLITTFLLFIIIEHLTRFYLYIYVMPAFLAAHPEETHSFVDMLEPYLFLINAWTGIYLTAYMSDVLTESSKSIISDLRNIQLWKSPKGCFEQIDLFMTQVQNSSTDITPLGLFVVNKTLISSMFMSLATYIIVLIQLSPELELYQLKPKI